MPWAQKTPKQKTRQNPVNKKTDVHNTATKPTPEQPPRPRKDPTWADIKAPEPVKPVPKQKPVIEEVQVFTDVAIGDWGGKKKTRVSAFDDLMKIEKEEIKETKAPSPPPVQKKSEERRKFPKANMPIDVANIVIPGPPPPQIPTQNTPRTGPPPMIICMRRKID